MPLLYGYWRSSATYRVRIALHLKQVAYQPVPLNLFVGAGEQNQPAYRQLNPEGRVPLWVDGDFRLGQSLAILQYLDGCHPQPPLLPDDPMLRARIWQFALAIAADTQPLQNVGVLNVLRDRYSASEEQRNEWCRHWISRGLSALEQEIADLPERAAVFGDAPGLADCCLVPQLYNARRFGVDTTAFPRLAATGARLEQLPAFMAAHPDRQPDAPQG